MRTVSFDPCPISELAPLQSDEGWLWHGYLARGNITLLTSLWKAGKTTLLAGLLRALGPGTPFLGHPCGPAAALVVSEESRSLWADRQRVFGIGPHARLLTRPFSGRPTPDQWDALVCRAEEMAAGGGLDLMVVDPLINFLPGGSESDPSSLLALLHPLRRLAEGGVAVLILHHPRKARSEEGSSARGSGALLGFVDVILELHRCGRLESDAHRRRLVGRSRLADTPRQLVYEWTPGTTDFRVVDDPQLARFRDNWETVRAILADRPVAATHKELLIDWPLDRPPLSATQLYEWLARAAGEGWVERTGSGTRSDPFRFRLPSTD